MLFRNSYILTILLAWPLSNFARADDIALRNEGIARRAQDRPFPDIPPETYAESIYQWQAEVRFLMIPGEDREGEGTNAQKMRLLKNVLDDRQQSPDNLYLAASASAIQMAQYSDTDTVQRLCAHHPPKSDDFRYLAVCEWYTESNPDIRARNVLELAENAHKSFPLRITGSQIYSDMAELLHSTGRTHEAILSYKRALEIVPKNKESTLMATKEGLALIYANALMSEKLQRLSIEYYNDVIAWHEAQSSQEDAKAPVSHVAYNRGIARIFLFGEFEKAIPDFKLGLQNEYLRGDGAVFLAYSLARAGRTQESLEARQQVDLNKVIDPRRRSFLQCYVDLTDYFLKTSRNLESCLNLQDPQVDVLINLTDILQTLPLTPSDENRMWRRFYRHFTQHLLPDMQKSVEVVSSQTELERERGNNRLNQLKIQNLSLYRNLSMALVGLAVILIALSVLGFRLWHASRRHARIIANERERLESILSNIEEGIIAIKSDLRLNPEMSEHLKAIVGDALLNNQPLERFLDLTQLEADQKSTVRECLLSSFGEDRLAWELNSANLPPETMIGGKHIGLFWAPVYHDERQIAVFLVLRDISSIRQLEREREEAVHTADATLQRARQIMANPKSAISFLHQLPEMLERIEQRMQDPLPETSILFQLAHSIKGTSRSLGFKDLQEASHLLEDALQMQDSRLFETRFTQLKLIAQSYNKAREGFLASLDMAGPSSIFDIAASLRAGIQAQLQNADIELAEIRVVESQTPSARDMQRIQDILLHGLSNAADHGFVRPSQKGLHFSPAIFEVAYRVQGQKKTLTIRDNGVGLNHSLIQKLAQEAGWIPRTGQDWSDFLFEDGVSTAENVSQSSGRGVGLSAIRANAKLLGGLARLKDNDQGPGTLLHVEWTETQDALQAAS